MQALAQWSVLVLVITALLGSARGLRADDPLASPESVGFSTDGLKTLQRTMRALVDDAKLAGMTTLVGSPRQSRVLLRLSRRSEHTCCPVGSCR